MKTLTLFEELQQAWEMGWDDASLTVTSATPPWSTKEHEYLAAEWLKGWNARKDIDRLSLPPEKRR